MSGYIRVLVRELQHVIATDLSSYLHTYIPSDDSLQYIALSEINSQSRYDDIEVVNES